MVQSLAKVRKLFEMTQEPKLIDDVMMTMEMMDGMAMTGMMKTITEDEQIRTMVMMVDVEGVVADDTMEAEEMEETTLILKRQQSRRGSIISERE